VHFLKAINIHIVLFNTESQGTIYSYFDFGLKPAVVSCLTNTLAPPSIALDSCSKLKRIGQPSRLHLKKMFAWGLQIFCE